MYAMQVGMHNVMHKRVGAMQISMHRYGMLCRYGMHYAMCAMQDGQAGRRKISWYALCDYMQETDCNGKLVAIVAGQILAEIRGKWAKMGLRGLKIGV